MKVCMTFEPFFDHFWSPFCAILDHIEGYIGPFLDHLGTILGPAKNVPRSMWVVCLVSLPPLSMVFPLFGKTAPECRVPDQYQRPIPLSLWVLFSSATFFCLDFFLKSTEKAKTSEETGVRYVLPRWVFLWLFRFHFFKSHYYAILFTSVIVTDFLQALCNNSLWVFLCCKNYG